MAIFFVKSSAKPRPQVTLLIERDPTPDVMDSLLRERIADPDPMKELSRGICGQILNSWQAGSWHYSPDGRLLLRALYPAETPSGIEEDELEPRSSSSMKRAPSIGL